MKKVKNYNRYPNDFKRKVALEYLSGRFSYAVAAEEYGLKDKGVVKEFVKWYRRNSELSQTTDTVPMAKPKAKSPTSKERELQKRIKDLELKVEALETMIDIAEEQLHIDIRKKSGSQQSKK
ncbi:MAG: transposase [Lewinellaceae bacterium]|nr:transposase [Lewinellaceae bacterium]MCB9315031.1 transposase [Lewinellaceae bacterium]MCB9334457.1 transposase [Lewinellaceae bacterium]